MDATPNVVEMFYLINFFKTQQAIWCLFFPFGRNNYFLQMTNITYIMFTRNCNVTKILAIKYSYFIWINLYICTIWSYLDLYTDWLKRLFLSCIEYICNSWSGILPPEFVSKNVHPVWWTILHVLWAKH